MNDNLFDMFGKTLNSMFYEERQETCIHCRKTWYATHYKDGVCHTCQKKNLPGRTEQWRRRAQREQLFLLIGSVAMLASLYFYFF